MLWSISAGLNVIHEHNLVHGHLHRGNVLVESKANSIDAKIADTGLHELVDKQISEQIYGVIPFVAPKQICSELLLVEPVFSKLMLLCLNVSPSNRPTVSHIFECLGNWVSNLSSQFDDTDVSFVNLKKLSLQSSLCHEKSSIIAVH
ncbi:unnamed protein product [Rhizophagus irregularis]|nr:unnamed protein product [Rhizophagus irregularis]